jgi:creatinine amidohydrolase
LTLTRFASTAAPDLRKLIADGAVALWPIGATEQHGGHLVTGFDIASATVVAERAAEQAAGEAVLLPGQAIGASEHWLDLGATLSLRPVTLIAVMADMIRSVERCGFGRLIIVNGHFGNIGPMTAAIGDADSFALAVEVVSYWQLVDSERLAAACVADQGGIGHAGEVETSIGLALDGLVAEGRIPAPRGRPLAKGDPGGPPGRGTVRLPRPLTDAPDGVFGDPSRARRALGELVLTEASTALAGVIDAESRQQDA